MPSAIAVEPLFLMVTVQLPLSKSEAPSTKKPICWVPFPLYLRFEIFKFFGDELTVAKFGRVDCIQLFGLHFTIYYAMNIKHSVNYCVSAFVNTNVTMITGIVFKFLNSKPPHLICQLSDRRPGVKIYKNICKDLIYDNMCNSLML